MASSSNIENIEFEALLSANVCLLKKIAIPLKNQLKRKGFVLRLWQIRQNGAKQNAFRTIGSLSRHKSLRRALHQKTLDLCSILEIMGAASVDVWTSVTVLDQEEDACVRLSLDTYIAVAGCPSLIAEAVCLAVAKYFKIISEENIQKVLTISKNPYYVAVEAMVSAAAKAVK